MGYHALLDARDRRAAEQEAAEKVKDRAAPVVDEAKSVAQEMGESLKPQAQEAMESVKDTATTGVEHVKAEGQDPEERDTGGVEEQRLGRPADAPARR